MQQKSLSKRHTVQPAASKASCAGAERLAEQTEGDLFLFSFLGVSQDDVGCDEHEAGAGPQQNKPHPEGVAERRPVLVDGISAHHGLQMAPGVVHEAGGDNVLDPCAGIGSRDPHQGLQVVGAEGHHDGGHQGNEGKHDAVHHPRVGAPVPVEQGLPVVAQRDGDDGEVGADGENRKQAQEVAQERDVQHVAVVREVQRVHVVQQRALEAEDGGEGEEDVEAEDQDVVREHQGADALLVGDGRHQGGKGVLTHEGVDAHAEQVGHPGQGGDWRGAFAGTFTDTDESQDDHHGERCGETTEEKELGNMTRIQCR